MTDKKNGPDYVAYSVRDSEDGSGHWDRVGAAFEHRDGKGLDVILNATPVNGRVTLRERAQDFNEKQQEQRHSEDQSQEQTRSRGPRR